jgi:hypothetical protein
MHEFQGQLPFLSAKRTDGTRWHTTCSRAAIKAIGPPRKTRCCELPQRRATRLAPATSLWISRRLRQHMDTRRSAALSLKAGRKFPVALKRGNRRRIVGRMSSA